MMKLESQNSATTFHLYMFTQNVCLCHRDLCQAKLSDTASPIDSFCCVSFNKRIQTSKDYKV